MSPEHLEYAELLLAKARNDLDAATALAAVDGISDDIVGFHVQQACEKALKAALVAHEREIPHTHSLARLIADLGAAGRSTPDEPEALVALEPWAVAGRYGEELPALLRPSAIELAVRTLAWARGVVTELR